jgi:adenine-specific DNA-methyltransferase
MREARRASALAASLQAKLEAQKSLKALEATRNRKRRELFDSQDAIDAQRDELIARIEKQLSQRFRITVVFRLNWSLIS